MDEKGFFYRDTWAEVDLDSIGSNVMRVRNLLPEEVDIIAVVKANAYGHGDIQIADAAIQAGATMLAVAFLDEGLSLRRKGISVPILVLGASRAEDVNVAANENITLTVFQESWLAQAGTVLLPGKELSLHIKVDSGMGRLGVRSEEELKSMEARFKSDPRFRLAGVFTHFATADELDDHYFQKQFARFEEMISVLATKPACIHTSNSAAALRYPGAYFNAVRLGIAMYGLAPSLEIKPSLPVELTEAFTLQSRLTQVKRLQKGDKVSYGATYEASSDEWIGTIPIGYADGWLRRLRGQEVLINGMRVPIVGRICMDQCMIRLPGEVPVGSAVTLIGKQQEERISIDEIATKLETINYEVPCLISSRVPRLYKKDGEIVGLSNPILKGDFSS